MANTQTVKNLATGASTGKMFVDRRDWYNDPNSYSQLFAEVAPFLFLAEKNKQSTKDPVFKLFQYENKYDKYITNNGSTVTIAAASSGASAESSAITIDGVTGYGLTTTVTSALVGRQYEVWDSTRTTKRGVCILTDDTSSTTAKFKSCGGAIATVDNDVFVDIGFVGEDGGEAPDAWSTELDVVWNQVQLFRTPVQLEGDILYAVLRGESDEEMRLNAEKLKHHRLAIDGALLKGKSPLGTNLAGTDTFTYADALVSSKNSKTLRSTYGIITAIEDYGSDDTANAFQNIFKLTKADTKYEDMVDMAEKMFQYYPTGGTLKAVAGRGVISFFQKLQWARSSKSNWTINVNPSAINELGKVTEVDLGHGVLQLSPSDSLKAGYNNTAVVVDDRYIKYMEMRPTQFFEDIKKENNYLGKKNEYVTECGLGMTHLKAHSLIKLS